MMKTSNLLCPSEKVKEEYKKKGKGDACCKAGASFLLYYILD